MDRRTEIEQTVKEILAKQLKMDPANIKSEALLTEELGLDSFGALESAFEMEEKFAIQIPNEALYNVKTVKDIVDHIVEQTKDKTNA
jgi:acyl carrier protein